MGRYLVYCVFFCHFVCTVTDFSAAEKARGVRFCMRVGLLSGQVFSRFCELWLAGSHGAAASRRGWAISHWHSPSIRKSAAVAIGIAGGSALLKAVWWDLRSASLLTHLFIYFFQITSWHFSPTVSGLDQRRWRHSCSGSPISGAHRCCERNATVAGRLHWTRLFVYSTLLSLSQTEPRTSQIIVVKSHIA